MGRIENRMATLNQKLLAALKNDRRIQAISIEEDRIAVLAQVSIRFLRDTESTAGAILTDQEFAELQELNAEIAAQQNALKLVKANVESHIKIVVTGTPYNDGYHPYVPKSYKMPAIPRPVWNVADEFADPAKAAALDRIYDAFVNLVGANRRNSWGFTWVLPGDAATYLNPGTPIPGDA